MQRGTRAAVLGFAMVATQVFVVMPCAAQPAAGQAPADKPPAATKAPTAAAPADDAAASEKADPVAHLVSVGRQARGRGKYAFAAHAFRQANDLKPQNALLFAVADAHYQRFSVKRQAFDRLRATMFLHRYLEAAPAGKSSKRARALLSELEALPAPEDTAELARVAKAERESTRMAVTSTVLGASVKVDGGEPQELPLFAEVKPGRHSLVISADGYAEEKRQVVAATGFIADVAVPLKQQPAKLFVSTSYGANVHVDGRFVGVAPLAVPTNVDPGEHEVLVTLNGHVPRREVLTLARGESEVAMAHLSVTDQRIAAAFVLGTGGAGVATGIVLGVLSVVDNLALNDAFQESEREALIESRDSLATGSLLAAGSGFALTVVGGALWVFDETEVTLSPTGPGDVGGTLSLRF